MNRQFGDANQVNSSNFNGTTLKLAEKFHQLFSHSFIFSDVFPEGPGHNFEKFLLSALIR